MNNHSLLARLSVARRDIGNLLFHFTRRPYTTFTRTLENGSPITVDSAAMALLSILEERTLNGANGNGSIMSGDRCVCFTEAPITELVSTFSLVDIAATSYEHSRYEPYGIAVRKDWLFAQGGRPVIYQKRDEYSSLSNGQQYRHVTYDPTRDNSDYTWEREWRIRVDQLPLEPERCRVIVPHADEAFNIVARYSALRGLEHDEYGNERNLVPEPSWLAVSLDMFGFRWRDNFADVFAPEPLDI